MRPPVAAGPMLRQCNCDSKDGSTAAEEEEGAAETTSAPAPTAAKKIATRIARLSYDPRAMNRTILRAVAIAAIVFLTSPAPGLPRAPGGAPGACPQPPAPNNGGGQAKPGRGGARAGRPRQCA